MEVTTKNAEETKDLGRKIGDKLVHRTRNKQHSKGATVFALVGKLGSGKTTFIQGLAEGLGIEKRILSPTFILMREYAIPPITDHRSPITNFYHIDLYRFGDNIKGELENLGIYDFMNEDKNLICIEWAQKAKEYLPKDTIWIEFDYIGQDERLIKSEQLTDTFLDQ